VVKNKNQKQKNRGAGEEDKKQEKRTERSTERRRSVAEKKKKFCRTAGSVLAWRERRKTPPLCSPTQGTNARDNSKR
jgi:hypothetical protein